MELLWTGMGHPEDVAKAVLFLVSDDAGKSAQNTLATAGCQY